MVAIKQQFSYLADGSIDTDAWLNKVTTTYHLTNNSLLQRALRLTQAHSTALVTFYGISCLQQSLEMAEILLSMKLDQDAVTAAMLASILPYTELPLEDINAEVGAAVIKLMQNVVQLNTLSQIKASELRSATQLERLHKLLLAMASDIRAVVIKLAERICIMRHGKNIDPSTRTQLAQETLDIYAPLANRLGIGQVKWELEDRAFHYTQPEAYQNIAAFLAERRIDREQQIKETIRLLQEQLKKSNIQATISGRAKHIYSIYLKAQRKQNDYQAIYDCSAVRILVPTLQDCYTTLSLVHSLFEYIPEEFDDYISNPKANGYRSIHTAVVGLNGKNLEIQIRTHDMHEEAEHGVAAHWIYKENKLPQSGYETKVTFLRQLLAWHQDVAAPDAAPEKDASEDSSERIFVFTPAGEIMDLPFGATPLDFAYHIHSELGHRCRGAKIKGRIVPLTYRLRMGDQIEIITTQQGSPSRDWLNKEAGYLTTTRARNKVAHWFKQQDEPKYIEAGKQTLERELLRAGIQHPSFEKIATQFHYKNPEALFAAIGHGNLRSGQVLQLLQTEEPNEASTKTSIVKASPLPHEGLQVAGINDLLTRIAKCCKPIPGDKIIGYITQGRGVSIHRRDCNNVTAYLAHQADRLVQVVWDGKKLGNYTVDLQIQANGTQDCLKELTALLANAKINLIALNSTTHKKSNMIYIIMTIQIQDPAQLKQLITQISQLPEIMQIKRMSDQ